MTFKIVTDVASEPVSVAEARLQCRLTDSDPTDEDGLIAVWITAAREAAEQYTGRSLAPKTLEEALDAFPGVYLREGWKTLAEQGRYPLDDIVYLPMGPVTAIKSVKYTDPTGVEQTLATNKYSLSLYGASNKLSPTSGNVWPVAQQIPDSVRIQYDCGYASDKLPKAAKAAMLLTIAHLWEHRSDVIVDSRAVAVELPKGAQSLLDTIKLWSR